MKETQEQTEAKTTINDLRIGDEFTIPYRVGHFKVRLVGEHYLTCRTRRGDTLFLFYEDYQGVGVALQNAS